VENEEPAVPLSAELDAHPFAELTATTQPARKSGVKVASAPETVSPPRPRRMSSTEELFLYLIAVALLLLLLCGVSLTGLILILMRR
jgi:hypothetical protein